MHQKEKDRSKNRLCKRAFILLLLNYSSILFDVPQLLYGFTEAKIDVSGLYTAALDFSLSPFAVIMANQIV